MPGTSSVHSVIKESFTHLPFSLPITENGKFETYNFLIHLVIELLKGGNSRSFGDIKLSTTGTKLGIFSES